MKKKREYSSSDLVKSFAKMYGFEDKLLALEVQNYLKNYLDETLFNEIENINLEENILKIKIKSPLLRNDFRLKKSFFLKKIQEEFGKEKFIDLYFL